MKLLVISDTHNKLKTASLVIERMSDEVEAVIHLGDMVSDASLLKSKFPLLTFQCVAGNCDYYYSADDGLVDNMTVEYNGVRLFVTHGHKYRVKYGYELLSGAASEKGIKVALSGHTHKPYIQTVNGVLIINPGSISFPRGRIKKPSYAVLSISDEGMPDAGIKYVTGQY